MTFAGVVNKLVLWTGLLNSLIQSQNTLVVNRLDLTNFKHCFMFNLRVEQSRSHNGLALTVSQLLGNGI